MKKLINIILVPVFVIYIFAGATPRVLLAQSQSKMTVAVLNFEAKGGISPNGAATLTDRLRTELVTLNKFTVLERGQMNTILEEQGFGQTGCTSSECAVEAGRLLGVQRMIAGDIGKIGEVMTIDIRVFDVETGRIVKALQKDHEGTASELLLLIKQIAAEISGVEVVRKKGFPWLWVSLGVIVIGGGVAALALGGGNGEENPVSNSLPDPDWPPGN